LKNCQFKDEDCGEIICTSYIFDKPKYILNHIYHPQAFRGTAPLIRDYSKGCYGGPWQMIVTPGSLNHFWNHPALELHFVVTGLILNHSLDIG
jgi:hypothetical protein